MATAMGTVMVSPPRPASVPATSAAMTTVDELMTDYPITVGIDSRLADAAEIMDFYHVTGLPVCDWSGSLVGVVSQTDVVHALASEQLRAAWHRLIVRHVMSHPAVTVAADASLVEAARLMQRSHIHRLVVVAPNGESVIGILSATDLVRWITDAAAS